MAIRWTGASGITGWSYALCTVYKWHSVHIWKLKNDIRSIYGRILLSAVPYSQPFILMICCCSKQWCSQVRSNVKQKAHLSSIVILTYSKLTYLQHLYIECHCILFTCLARQWMLSCPAGILQPFIYRTINYFCTNLCSKSVQDFKCWAKHKVSGAGSSGRLGFSSSVGETVDIGEVKHFKESFLII